MRERKGTAAAVCAALAASAGTLFADSDLLFLEAQLVGGYSTRERGFVGHSADAHDAMQKSSVGFDYVRKFSGDGGDWGAAAVQFRLAFDDGAAGGNAVEAQLYNAFFKMKSPAGDFWAGHNRVAFGLASYWDTHADLLGDLTMLGVSFDRDWGAGWSLDTARGNVSASLTTGSGMSLRTDGNWLAGTRVGFGVLDSDNGNVGASAMFGKTLDAMGYDVMSRAPDELLMLGFDAAWNADAFEQKIELDGGQKARRAYFAALYRFSVKLDADERARLEFQPAFVREKGAEDWTLGAGTSFRLTADLTLRVMAQYRRDGNDRRLVGQLYYYLPI